jgi:hypothetical protein
MGGDNGAVKPDEMPRKFHSIRDGAEYLKPYKATPAEY